ncbi:TIGR03564 family F420-dependent LLM class oxidoreductase [Pseudonocardia spinosispora]|uniref:TIGR03564 family F420-dependent LLM class oxidoreductase n=1 Tax=Pseudonocardia spinosispora TaxID=103441 RepID=UPI00042266DB|nr:TIGR03564 family F420-dependent LLM class oxidoreductase [Pseudonocardia spinosispora]
MNLGTVLAPYSHGDDPAPANLVDFTVNQAATAHRLGIRSGWFGQRFDYDAVALAALVGRAVPGFTVGTSAVPIIGRHPILLGSLAQTAQAATGGHFQLGIALGARDFLRDALGTEGTRQITHLREFLTALHPLLETGSVDYSGELVTARTPFPSAVPGAQPAPPVLVAAMGPQALRVAGSLADGTLPFLAGPRTLSELIVPTITEAAAAAGRPRPRIVAVVAGVVTDAVARTRDRAHREMAFYESIPSYRAVLDREGVSRAGDLAMIGSEDEVSEQLQRYFDAGATEVIVGETEYAGPEDQLRTWELLGTLT